MMNRERVRISERLAQSANHRVTLITAPAGYGKSEAIDAYVRLIPGEVLRFNVRRSHASLARFTRALAAAFEPSLPRMGQSLAIAHERAVQSPRPSDILATWLAGHLEGPQRTIVIDDLHHCEGDRQIASLISAAIERSGAHVRWILATRTNADLPLATWLARGDADLPIDERVLRLTNAEALAIAHEIAPELPHHIVVRLCEETHGSISPFVFALRTLAGTPEIAEQMLAYGGPVFDRFANFVFERFSNSERARLIETAALPDVDDSLIGTVAGETPWIAEIAAIAPQIFQYDSGRRHYHGLFFRWLRERLDEQGTEAVRNATLRAAEALERVGRIGEALGLYIRERHDAGLIRLIESHGFAFLEAGYGESIREAIDAMDQLVQMSSAAVLAIKAIAESQSGRFDTAESWFQLALARADASLRVQIAYQYGSHLLRFFRPEAVDVFESLVKDEHATEKLRAYALAALGPAYVFERRLDDARRSTDEALALALTLGSPHVLAKCNFQAGYVALYAHDAARANRLASTALMLSNEHGFFDVAAGALSVLYNVASDIEDDPAESLRLLEAVGDNAAKSGSLANQLISLVASLEIEIERNNEAVAERIDEKLQTLDVNLANRATYEALLPTQALRSSWTGDFVGAFRLLEHSAEQQWSEDRKALRFAEMAAYAAAAGLDQEASRAIRSVSEILAEVGEIDLRVQRARLVQALASIVLGAADGAEAILALVDMAPEKLSRRLYALRRAIGALLDRARGIRNHSELLERLTDLESCGFAGIARMITMLPMGSFVAAGAAVAGGR